MNDEVQTENRMEVSKEVMNELLLVCSVITSTSEGEKVVPVTDCVNWLQDLQRVLRRDDDVFRSISLTVGSWKIVEKKLIPLVVGCRYNSGMVLTIVKILVILTKPMSSDAIRHVRGSDCKGSEAVIAEQMKMHRNALAQNKQLMEYKKVICGAEGSGLLSVLGGLLAEPLSREGIRRTDSDHMIIELVLHLLRNLLAAQPLMKTNAEVSREAEQLHHKLLILLEKELALDLVLAISQQLEAPENAHYNLLILEILHYMFRNQDPTLVAMVHVKDKKRHDGLKSQLKQEKQFAKKMMNVRHANFGGSVIVQQGGTKKVISSSILNQPSINNGKQSRRKPNSLPFIGNKHTGTSDITRHKLQSHSPTTHKSHLVLYKFCTSFLNSAYGPFAKSLKHEFRRDSVRLEQTDFVLFFRISTFFFQFYLQTNNQSNTISNLVFSMDVFSFTMLFNTIETFQARKLYSEMEACVALYRQMMSALLRMRTTSNETEKVMAMGLMDTLFYTKEPIDKLQKLFSWWKPGSFSRTYLCDLVEITHAILKLLDLDQKEINTERRTTRDITSRFQAAASDFNPQTYFLKLVTPHSIKMYTDLLSQYQLNTPQVNHHIVAFFTKMCKTILYKNENTSQEDIQTVIRTEMNLKNVTLEPMLYNIHSIITFTNIIQEVSYTDQENQSLVKFLVAFFKRFSQAAERNPLIFVECLMKQGVHSRFCTSITNLYCTEELVMMVERDMLIQQVEDAVDGKINGDAFGDEKDDTASESIEKDSSDEELEVMAPNESFVDKIGESEKKRVVEEDSPKNELKRLKKRHVIDDESEEEALFE